MKSTYTPQEIREMASDEDWAQLQKGDYNEKAVFARNAQADVDFEDIFNEMLADDERTKTTEASIPNFLEVQRESMRQMNQERQARAQAMCEQDSRIFRKLNADLSDGDWY